MPQPHDAPLPPSSPMVPESAAHVALREVEARLRASEAHLAAFVLASGQIPWTARSDGHDEWEQDWTVFTRHAPQLGATEHWLAAVHPDDQERVATAWQTAVATQQLYHIDYRLRHPDREYRWLSVRGVPVRGSDGRVREWVGTATERTEQHRTEEQLRASETMYRQLADSISQLAWMAHPDGHIFWYNQRWYDYTGTTPASQEGWEWQSVHDPQMLPQVLAQWQQSIATGAPFDMTFPLKGADGHFRPFLTRVMPVTDHHGHVTGWFGTNTDISEQRAAEDDLRAANHLKDEFLGIVSHELRTPLTTAKSNIQLAIRRLAQIPLSASAEVLAQVQAVQVLLTRSEGALNRLNHLVDDLLDVTRIHVGKLVLRRQHIDVAALVREVVADEAVAWPQRRIVLAPELDEAVWVEADPERIRQVITNYLTNALKYAPREAPIQLRLTRTDDMAQLSVSDHGPGLTPEQQAQVFEQFYRVEGMETQQGSQVGLGLGLYICRIAIEQHGGAVGVSSTLGMGSTFWCTLPLTARQ